MWWYLFCRIPLPSMWLYTLLRANPLSAITPGSIYYLFIFLWALIQDVSVAQLFCSGVLFFGGGALHRFIKLVGYLGTEAAATKCFMAALN